ncbi:hypothetical protein GCK72_009063 [Caenorhabditis remanei]|uniref:Domain of unknown function WSN domain-containing protein n=1 Tax=Caenorhabditis remanei TaxID=31234 RepID=A0A6A5H2I9_CAERE|nr:hypothetical protein GCK72_009063 [Caenorhabditis remanei]KAF1760813.1 hypothetical protein GCK72_009063 [Caenorhabditis remanei]
MRIHKIIILSMMMVVVVEVAWTRRIGRRGVMGGEQETDFEIMFDNLSLLARVTNAIALHSAILRKSLSIHDMLAETIFANPRNFSDIFEHDASGFNKTFDELVSSYQNIKKATDQYYNEMVETGIFTEKLIEAMEMDYDIEHTVIQKYFENLKNLKINGDVMGCDKDLVKNTILKFWKVMNEKSVTFSTGSQKKDALEAMKLNTSIVLKCMDSFKTYIEKVNPIIQRSDKLRKVIFAREMSRLLKSDNSKSFNYSTSLATVKTMFAETIKNWKPPKDKAYKMIKKSNSLFLALDDQKFIPEQTLTVGFGYFNRLREDVKSEWFKEKISMGKSTKSLENGLEAFFEFGVLVEKLRRTYIMFSGSFYKNQDFLEKYPDDLMINEEFDEMKTGEEFIGSSRKVFEDCWSKTPEDSEVFQEFDESIGGFIHLNNTISDILNWVNETIGTFDMEVVKISLGKLHQLDFGDKNLNEAKEAISGIPNFQILNNFLSRFSTLSELQTTLDTDYTTTFETFNMTEIFISTIQNLTDSSMTTDLRCLKTNQFNTTRLNDLMMFMESIRRTSAENLTNHMKNLMSFYNAMREAFSEIEVYVKKHRNITGDPGNPVLKFKDPQRVSYAFGSGIRAVSYIWDVSRKRADFMDATKYSKEVKEHIAMFNENEEIREFWKNDPNASIHRLFDEIDRLSDYCRSVKNKDLMTIRDFFDHAKNVTGFKGHYRTFWSVQEQLISYGSKDPSFDFAIKNAIKLSQLDLDFSNREATLQAAKLSAQEIKDYFDEIFGLKEVGVTAEKKKKITENSYLTVVAFAVPLFLLLFSCAFLLYALSDNGKRHIKNFYLYYFGKSAAFEKRWRYSLFMDRQDGVNALHEAVREVNAAHVSEVVKGGAYINVYNLHGNTPLHCATKLGFPEIVEILIKNGADRTLRNAQNETPEQMLTYRSDEKKREKFDEIERIYAKNRDKKFRIQVPEVFPSFMFHIYADRNTDDELTNKFMEQFQAITKDGRTADKNVSTVILANDL